jgi:hypothetical protein
VRVRFMRRRDVEAAQCGGEPFCVLLLEDVRTAEARLRQEKLAAMGRVSAGIAHEIRNPLAAIAQANALLLEDELGATQQRLARMVADNVERLKRIVDDVMEVAPGADGGARDRRHRRGGGAAAEWARTVDLPLGADSRLRVELPTAAAGRERSTPSTCAACWSTCWTTRTPRQRRAGAIFLRWRRATTPRACCRWPATARRSRPRSSATCSSPSSRRAAAAPGLACTFAASCASATAPASNTAPAGRRAPAQRVPRGDARGALSPANATLGLVP